MAVSIQQMVIIAPLLVSGTVAWANENTTQDANGDPFAFNPSELDRIRFTRSEEFVQGATNLEGQPDDQARPQLLIRQTAVSFKLKPKRPVFSREGAYGLDLFTDPRLDVRSALVWPEDPSSAMSGLHHGFEYSAGLTIEHEDEQIDGTAYVSSSLLGLSYGRMGRLWYGGVDVNLEQFATTESGESPSDILTLDVTTGRRLGLTGLEAHSPLWLLSVQGNVDMNEWEKGDDLESSSYWYLNPSLFWQQPGFTFSAQMQVPVELEALNDEGEPDYRLRAVFEKQFK